MHRLENAIGVQSFLRLFAWIASTSSLAYSAAGSARAPRAGHAAAARNVPRRCGRPPPVATAKAPNHSRVARLDP